MYRRARLPPALPTDLPPACQHRARATLTDNTIHLQLKADIINNLIGLLTLHMSLHVAVVGPGESNKYCSECG